MFLQGFEEMFPLRWDRSNFRPGQDILDNLLNSFVSMILYRWPEGLKKFYIDSFYCSVTTFIRVDRNRHTSTFHELQIFNVSF